MIYRKLANTRLCLPSFKANYGSIIVVIDTQSQEVFDTLVEQMKATEDTTEKFKEENQTEWVCHMQNVE